MKEKISIRSLNQDDFPQLLSLFNEFAAFEKRPELMTNTLDRMYSQKAHFTGFVAVLPEDKIIGYATYNFVYYTWSGKSIYMDDLYIKPEFRGDGLGTRLINKVINFAKENSCQKVKWQVSHWNEPAKAFYKSLGAVIDDEQHNCDLKLT